VEGIEGEAEGGVGVACAGARGETVPNGFGVASLGATAVGIGTTVGAALGAASVEPGGAGVGGSDLEEHAAAAVTSINASTAKKRRFAFISNVSSS